MRATARKFERLVGLSFDASRLDIPVANEGKTGYAGVNKHVILDFGEHGSFVVLIYGAFCAYGLFGPEQNGILILDEGRKHILLDRHCEQTTGYFGPSNKQIAEWERIRQMEWETFQEFVNTNLRSRYTI
jgi:hypothetical protein